ncbi:Uncharacterised protein [Candidatus Burarchaeum australiense]|nr:Uncharacterised protein [Candidatus Burarchaeum australiense]
MSEELLGIIATRKELHAIERLKAEQALAEKFGADALRVYVKIDGLKNAEELRSDAGLDEAKFLEILGFLEDRGLITTKTVFEAELEQKKGEKK